MFTSLKSNKNNDRDEVKRIATSFRHQILLQKNKTEQLNNKGNNQINIRLSINSEIISNNYPKDSKNNTELINNSSFKDNIIKDKDKMIQELKKEILNTRQLINKMRKEKIKITSSNMNNETKNMINMVKYNTLLSNTKQQTQLSLSEKLFFQNSTTLKKKLIPKTRFMSPKSCSPSFAYLDKETRPNSPFDPHSVKGDKNYSNNHILKSKNIIIKQENNQMKTNSIVSIEINHDNQIMADLLLIKERMTKVFEKYNSLNSKCKSPISSPSRILIQNYLKNN